LKKSKTIQILFFGLIPVGIVILFFSIRHVKRTYSGNIILEIPYALESAEFILDKPGNYSIWQIGEFFRKAPLDEFRPEITDLTTGLQIKLSSRIFRPNANNGWKARMKIFRFSAPPGKYILELKECSSISSAEHRLIVMITAGMVDYEKYFIQIRESQPLLLNLSGIVGIVWGGFCITGGLVSGILSFST